VNTYGVPRPWIHGRLLCNRFGTMLRGKARSFFPERSQRFAYRSPFAAYGRVRENGLFPRSASCRRAAVGRCIRAWPTWIVGHIWNAVSVNRVRCAGRPGLLDPNGATRGVRGGAECARQAGDPGSRPSGYPLRRFCPNYRVRSRWYSLADRRPFLGRTADRRSQRELDLWPRLGFAG